MRRNARRVVLGISALAGLGLALGGCSGFREAAGFTKQPPDEFAVVTKAPLIIPPDYNLRPPKPGAAPTNQVTPSAAAETALFSDDPATVAGSIPGQYSEGERLLLAYAHAANADHGIRQEIASDNTALQGASDDFTNKLLFSSTEDTSDAPLDADAEKKRLDESKSGTPAPDQKANAPKQDDSKKDSGGWFDWIF